MAGCEGDGVNGRTYITRRKKKKNLKKKYGRGKWSRTRESLCTLLRPATYALIQRATLALALATLYF